MSLKPSDSVRPLEPTLEAAHAPQSTLNANDRPADDARALRPEERPHVLIESEESGVQLDLGDFWTYRELLYFLTWRDVKVRYKQTLMGAAWVIIQPLLTMFVVTLVFNKFGGLETGEQMPYPLFAYAGLLLWTFFANAVNNSTTSLVQNTSLITKVYFPRMFIPAAAVAAGLVDFAVASVILIGLMIYYHVALTWHLLLLPVYVLLVVLLALAVGLLISALTVKYRDLRHVLPFMLQFWMFASPIIYPLRKLQGRWYWLLTANPVTGIVEGFRAALAGHAAPLVPVLVSVALTLALLVCAIYLFRRLEVTFADVI
ncbi:MAG: phosphate ABC transporter permease [Acidobacteria bacterium]|nr:MAG: phosphate ABC transporter permease [Acidobacteriota bacterium]